MLVSDWQGHTEKQHQWAQAFVVNKLAVKRRSPLLDMLPSADTVDDEHAKQMLAVSVQVLLFTLYPDSFMNL